MAKVKETVRVMRPTKADRLGDAGAPTLVVERKDAILAPRTSTENASRGEVIIDGLTVWLPKVFTPIKGTDIIEARGSSWQIEGAPGVFAGKGTMLTVKRLA